jgi:hypothetical protein
MKCNYNPSSLIIGNILFTMIFSISQLASSAGILEGLTEKQIKDFVKVVCKERFKS